MYEKVNSSMGTYWHNRRLIDPWSISISRGMCKGPDINTVSQMLTWWVLDLSQEAVPMQHVSYITWGSVASEFHNEEAQCKSRLVGYIYIYTSYLLWKMVSHYNITDAIVPYLPCCGVYRLYPSSTLCYWLLLEYLRYHENNDVTYPGIPSLLVITFSMITVRYITETFTNKMLVR